MSPAAAAQLAFAAEFATFVAAATGLAAALRPGVLSEAPWARSALASGFLGLAVAAFLRGAVIVAEPDRPLLQVVRLVSGLAIAAGLVRWPGRRSGAAVVVALVAFAASGLVVQQGGSIQVADALRLVAAAALAVGLASAARRSIAARIAVTGALLVLVVVLGVALTVSVTVADNVEGEALGRYTARAAAEADAAGAEARSGLGPARLIAGVLAAERPEALERVADADTPAPDDVALLADALTGLTDDQLLDLDDPVVLLAPDGAPVAAVPAELSAAARLSLAGAAVVDESLAVGAERQGVAVIGDDAFAVASVPVVLRPDGSQQRAVGSVVVARRLDDTYLRVLGTGGEDLAFVLATPTRVVARSGAAADDAVTAEVAAAVIDDGERPSRRDADGFLAAAPVLGGDGRPVLALVVTAPDAAAEATQEALFRALFLVALAAALFAVGLAAVVGERIGRGLARLTEAARSLQAGSLDTRIRVRSEDELGVLGEAFSSMAASIRVMTDELRAVAAEETELRGRLEAVVAGMGEALLAVDADGAVIEINRSAEELLGVRRDDVLGRPGAEALSWRLLDGSTAPLDREDLVDGRSMEAELAVGDATIPVVATTGTLRGEGDEAVGAVVVLRDVRPEREVDDLKSAILANIGHELRTPLTPIKGYAGMLRSRTLDADRTRAFAGEIIDGVDQLERVIGQLVTFATIAAGHLTVDAGEIAVADLAEGVRARWADRVTGAHRFHVDVGDGAGSVALDRALFDRALDELIDNAVKYSPDGGPVEVRFGRRRDADADPGADDDGVGGALTVSVVDRGIGIAPERLAELAEAFTQADQSATRRFDGLGLGLACADRIVRAHGGRLAYASNGRRGTTVSIVVPVDAGEGTSP